MNPRQALFWKMILPLTAASVLIGSSAASVALPACSQYGAIGLLAPLAWIAGPLLLIYSEPWTQWPAAAAVALALLGLLLRNHVFFALALCSSAALAYGVLAMKVFCEAMSV